MNNFEFEAVGIGEEDRVVARRILWVFGGSIKNLSAHLPQELVEAIDVRPTRGAKRDVVQTGRVPIVPRRMPIALRRLKGDREQTLVAMDALKDPEASVTVRESDGPKPEVPEHRAIEGLRDRNVRNRQINVVDASALHTTAGARR